MEELNKKMFYLKLLFILFLGIGNNQIKSYAQEIQSINNHHRDSLINNAKKNFPKSYNWDSLTKKYPTMELQCLLISREKLEDINLKYYSQKGFKYLYDSLSSIYKSFNDCNFHCSPELAGHELSFNFLIDSCNVYNLMLFIPKIPHQQITQSKKKLLKYALKQRDFAVLAFKYNECNEIKKRFGNKGTKKYLTQTKFPLQEYYRKFYKLREKMK